MLNLELYKVFYAVAKCGSITKAAEELFISQPAVSQSVKLLENQLGVPLFRRTHSGMVLSAGGKLIYKQIGEALNLIEGAETCISEMQDTVTGTIRIGATDAIFSYILADKIAEFNLNYPAVRLELISSTTPQTLYLLKNGGCDIAFVNLPAEDDGVTFLETVSHLSDIFVAGEKFASLQGEVVPLKRLQEFPLLMIEENTIARRSLSAFLKGHGTELRPDIEVANWDLMKKLAVKGAGLGCVPREYCVGELENGSLFEVKTSPALPVRGVGIALPKKSPVPYAVKKFTALFKEGEL